MTSSNNKVESLAIELLDLYRDAKYLESLSEFDLDIIRQAIEALEKFIEIKPALEAVAQGYYTYGLMDNLICVRNPMVENEGDTPLPINLVIDLEQLYDK